MGDRIGLVVEEKVLVLMSVVVEFAFIIVGPEDAGLLTMVDTLFAFSPWISVRFFSSLACCLPTDVGDKPGCLEERKDAFLGNRGDDFGNFFDFVKDGRPSFSIGMRRPWKAWKSFLLRDSQSIGWSFAFSC